MRSLVEMDGCGKGFAPDEAYQLIVGGKLPVLPRGLGTGVDIEAAEEAVDALVGEAAFTQDANLLHEDGVYWCGIKRRRLVELGGWDEDRICEVGVWVGHNSRFRFRPSTSIAAAFDRQG